MSDPVESMGARKPGESVRSFSFSDQQNPSPSRYLASGAPQTCAHCGSPFGLEGDHRACWRGADQRYYCSEACAATARRARKSAA